MTTTNAQIGFGATIAWETSPGSGVYTTAVEVTDITPPASKTDSIEVTHMGSTGGVKEFIAGLTDPGVCQVKMNYAPASATDASARTWRSNREKRSVVITFANTHTATFSAFVTDYVTTNPLDGKMECTLSMKVSGAVTIA